ncbi:MAG: 23S rRNA (uracil(1939)-C(5))-methyltransferase RlmD [Eubacterium sp.]|nr:23S rRNA (uracil(1939)-C(5))-methyltransferase RlmD [Eubacterium sp.]
MTFPNKGYVYVEGEPEPVVVKNALPGQTVSFCLTKKKHGKLEGNLLSVTGLGEDELAEPACVHAGICGGCIYQSLPYEKQLEIKQEQVLSLLRPVLPDADELFEEIKESPRQFGYRNKMEYTFGDEYKDGPLSVGMHKRGAFYDIVPVTGCRIADADFGKILQTTRDYFAEKGIPHFHRMRHDGYLRHLLVRKAAYTGEILIDLVTTGAEGLAGAALALEADASVAYESLEQKLLSEWRIAILELSLEGKIAGILHTTNDSVADVVKDEGTQVLYGKDSFEETCLGLSFTITPFSFFQTNSLGAEVLYETAREYISDELAGSDKTVYDLYSGTGTIAQLLAPAAKKVIGVEIVEEAVDAARINAKKNGLDNCEFLAGDVLKVLDEITEKPDLIVLDPPRDGVHPKALNHIISYGVDSILYISCKPTSLARDLVPLQTGGYQVKRLCCVDMFPGTANVETVALLSKRQD